MTLDFLALEGDVETVAAPPDTKELRLNSSDNRGMTPFLVAVESGASANVDALLGVDGVNYQATDRRGVSLLFIKVQFI